MFRARRVFADGCAEFAGDVSFDYKDILALDGNDWLNHHMKHPELISIGVVCLIGKILQANQKHI
jgi:hypothetical protein